MLVADIGGTNARFAIADRGADETFKLSEVRRLDAAAFETICDAAAAYLEMIGERPRRACFAAAGPVEDDGVDVTNSHWRLDKAEISAALALDDLKIVNDFSALAAGVDQLAASDFIEVKTGEAVPSAPILVIGPGTGLGQALVVPTRQGRQIIATEGGHISFAPRTDQDVAVMQFLAQDIPYVSNEQLLSGPGLGRMHRALSVLAGRPLPKARAAAEITGSAADGSDPIAMEAVAMFCGLLGRVVGDAVLSTGARGGVVLGGGILPKIIEVFLKSDFVERFGDKGPMRAYMAKIPVRMISSDEAALLGAAALSSPFSEYG